MLDWLIGMSVFNEPLTAPAWVTYTHTWFNQPFIESQRIDARGGTLTKIDEEQPVKRMIEKESGQAETLLRKFIPCYAIYA